MRSWTIGDVVITCLSELELPGLKWILPDATPEKLSPISWLRPHFVDAAGEAVAAVQTFIAETANRRVLIDTCIGNDKDLPVRRWSMRQGTFLRDLEAAGFPAESIDTVLCTHLHMDHVGWNTQLVDDRWVPTFRNAAYLFGRTEWEHWNFRREGFEARVLEQSVDPVVEAGLHRLVDVDHRICDEIRLEPTPGHTPGHVSVCIASQGMEAVITGDLLHHPAQVARPEWGCVADFNRQQAWETRRAFIERFSGTPTLIIGTHFAAPTAGRIIPDGGSHRFVVD